MIYEMYTSQERNPEPQSQVEVVAELDLYLIFVKYMYKHPGSFMGRVTVG